MWRWPVGLRELSPIHRDKAGRCGTRLPGRGEAALEPTSLPQPGYCPNPPATGDGREPRRGLPRRVFGPSPERRESTGAVAVYLAYPNARELEACGVSRLRRAECRA